MYIKKHRGWEIPEQNVTPERLVVGRRGLLAGAGAASIIAPRMALAQGAPRNAAYDAGREITAEKDATTYNNYYEFGTDKSIHRAAQKLPVTPWTIKFDGMVGTPRTMDLDDILKQVRL